MKLPIAIAEKLNPTQTAFLQSFFKTCPDSFAKNLIWKSYPQNHTLIHAGESSHQVYFLLAGRLQAGEEQEANGTYHFTELPALQIVGDYEVFSKKRNRMVTLKTLTGSQFIIVPAKAYLDWIKNDANALFIRLQMLVEQLVEENSQERRNHFLDNRTKLLRILWETGQERPDRDQRINEHEPFPVKLTREEIAARVGCSVRTVNRIVARLDKENRISLVHGKIHLSGRQYRRMADEHGFCR